MSSAPGGASGPAPFSLSEDEFRAYARRMGQRQAQRFRHGQGPRATALLLGGVALICAALAATGAVRPRVALILFILTVLAGLISRFVSFILFAGTAARLAAEAGGDPTLFKGERRIQMESDWLAVEHGGRRRQVPYASIRQAERADGLLLLWTGTADAIVIPVRAFDSPDTALEFLDSVKARTSGA